ncbi:hypothetical protein H2199_008745 [Coniosporium tulheliwenetii]|uniref:Uncharacterized protein n=1 Tax=Coniosporium tulheliwenetii TaxID=3383036 RepID=A0ACC2YIQ8_9PEZI|nr:hypothetical protein H2199_008745 [Cladosporium sp. JES 115]
MSCPARPVFGPIYGQALQDYAAALKLKCERQKDFQNRFGFKRCSPELLMDVVDACMEICRRVLNTHLTDLGVDNSRKMDVLVAGLNHLNDKLAGVDVEFRDEPRPVPAMFGGPALVKEEPNEMNLSAALYGAPSYPSPEVATTPEEETLSVIASRVNEPRNKAPVVTSTYKVLMHGIRVGSMDMTPQGKQRMKQAILRYNKERIPGAVIVDLEWLPMSRRKKARQPVIIDFLRPEDANAAIDNRLLWDGINHYEVDFYSARGASNTDMTERIATRLLRARFVPELTICPSAPTVPVPYALSVGNLINPGINPANTANRRRRKWGNGEGRYPLGTRSISPPVELPSNREQA